MSPFTHCGGRRILPAWPWLLLSVGILAVPELFQWFLRTTLFAGISADEPAIVDYVRRLQPAHAVVIGLAILAHVFRRFWRFWPYPETAYHRWLTASPWDAPQRLPLGPWLPTWQDALVVVGLTLYALRFGAIGWVVPFAYLGVWTLCGMLTLVSISRHTTAAVGALVLAIGTHVALWWPIAGLAAVPLGWLFVAFGLHRAIPDLREWPNCSDFLPAASRETRWFGRIGWPHGWLQPEPNLPSVDRRIALLWTTVLFAGLTALPWEDEGFVLAALLVNVGVAGRIIFYLYGYASPLSFWARLGTGRWIVPAYDRWIIAPLCAILAHVAFFVATFLEWLPLPVGGSLSICVPLLLLLCMGPSLETWHFTAPHTYRPSRVVPRIRR